MFLAPHFVLTFVILEHLRRLSVKWMVDRELVQEATRTFRFFDVHKNGFITREELAMAMQLAYPTEMHVIIPPLLLGTSLVSPYRWLACSWLHLSHC